MTNLHSLAGRNFFSLLAMDCIGTFVSNRIVDTIFLDRSSGVGMESTLSFSKEANFAHCTKNSGKSHPCHKCTERVVHGWRIQIADAPSGIARNWPKGQPLHQPTYQTHLPCQAQPQGICSPPGKDQITLCMVFRWSTM